MRIKRIFASFLVCASVVIAISACTNPEPLQPKKEDPEQPEQPQPEQPQPEQPEQPEQPSVSNLLDYKKDVVLTSSGPKWIDFQTGKIYTQVEVAASKDLQKTVDLGFENKDGGVYFRNSGLYTRFSLLDKMTKADFDAIVSKTSLSVAIQDVVWDDAHAPKTSVPVKTVPAYMAFKTWTEAEDNMYGVLEITSIGEGTVTLSYKFGKNNPGGQGEYTGARKVTISKDGKMYVDGEEFYIKGAAATMKHTLMAQYGANTCRIYGASASTSTLLDQLHEAGLMCMVGFSPKSYKELNDGKTIDNSSKTEYDKWYDKAYRDECIAKYIEVVKALKDHPAVLCWNLANEIESGSDSNYQKGMYMYLRDLDAEIKKIDPNHPTTYSFTEKPSKLKMDNIMSICPNLDFICFNTYYSYLKNPRFSTGSGASTFRGLLVNSAGVPYEKPFAITEYGPTGTWDRGDLLSDQYISNEGRINNWGALIQLSSDEAALNYIDCYNIIKNSEKCIGSVAFWWGFQSHGEVLGWYPFFTKSFEILPAVDALESCWRGIEYKPKAPSLASWKSSIELNGKNAADPAKASGGKADKNPVLAPGQACTAEVFAKCTSGNPDSSLKYKWFIYKDATYIGSDPWTSVTVAEDGEWVATSYGKGMSMNEDARANLFKDRTLAKVEFTAPTEKGNYRLYCIVSDPSNNRAGTVCLNFQVK